MLAYSSGSQKSARHKSSVGRAGSLRRIWGENPLPWLFQLPGASAVLDPRLRTWSLKPAIPHPQTTVPHLQIPVPHPQIAVPHPQTSVPHPQAAVPHPQIALSLSHCVCWHVVFSVSNLPLPPQDMWLHLRHIWGCSRIISPSQDP